MALKITTKLHVLNGIAILAVFLVSLVFLWNQRASDTELKETKTQHVVETAHGAIRHYLALAQQGKMPED